MVKKIKKTPIFYTIFIPRFYAPFWLSHILYLIKTEKGHGNVVIAKWILEKVFVVEVG